MTNIITFDGFENSDIRVTPSGEYSVFDVIKFCGKKNPRDAWNTLLTQYSEVVAKTDNFKFPGRGQRNTPVATRQNMLYIIGLLPGAVGRSYRESAAKVFLQYLEASPELAESVINRATPEDLRRIEERLKARKIRVAFTATLQNHGVTEGWQFGAITNEIYKPILGGTAKQIRADRNLPTRVNIRENISMLEDVAVSFAEQLTQRDIKRQNLNGFHPCKDSAAKNAANVSRLVND